jgi:hypothetical protein
LIAEDIGVCRGAEVMTTTQARTLFADLIVLERFAREHAFIGGDVDNQKRSPHSGDNGRLSAGLLIDPIQIAGDLWKLIAAADNRVPALVHRSIESDANLRHGRRHIDLPIIGRSDNHLGRRPGEPHERQHHHNRNDNAPCHSFGNRYVKSGRQDLKRATGNRARLT